MCELCDENGGEPVGCQDCGRLICFDEKPSRLDVISQAYVTASGDLYCRECGIEYDKEEEEYDSEMDFGFDEPSPDEGMTSEDYDLEEDNDEE